jgi:hypothetical protein
MDYGGSDGPSLSLLSFQPRSELSRHLTAVFLVLSRALPVVPPLMARIKAPLKPVFR